jgi:hypothetical protein
MFLWADARFMFLDLKICSGAMICADYVQGVAPIETQ